MERGWFALVAVAGCFAEGPNVELRAPRPDLTADERVATFNAYRAEGEMLVVTSTCRTNGGCQDNEQLSMRMANGTVIYHPEDLQPLVPADSDTARAIDRTSSGMIRTLVAGGVGAVAMAIGGYMWIEGQSQSSPDPTERNIGSGVFLAGVVAISVAYYL